MSKFYGVVYLSIFVYGNLSAQSIKQEDVEKIANILAKEDIVTFNKPVQRVKDKSSLEKQLLEKINAKDYENVSITKFETAIDRSKVKVPNTTVERDHARQYISGVDSELLQIALGLDDEVEMDETIYLTFSEKYRGDRYEKTLAEDSPYAVLVQASTRDENDIGLLCSGSLLTPRWVLTAAHCFEMDVYEIHVSAGFSTVQDLLVLDVNTQEEITKTYYKHPKYSAATYQKLKYDIAMVKLDKAFKMTRTVNTVQLSKSEWKSDGYKACMLTGFGDLGEDFDRKRNTLYLEVKNSCPCLNDSRDDILMSSKSREDYGLCGGDLGGGLICDGELVAVACAIITLETIENCIPVDNVDCKLNNTMSVFQKTGPYLDWINSKLNSVSNDCSCHRVVIGVLVFLSLIYLSSLLSF